jgi:hypothetical protein
VPGSTTWRAIRSASMTGREYGGLESRVDTVDLPVAMEPVRPRRSIVAVARVYAQCAVRGIRYW